MIAPLWKLEERMDWEDRNQKTCLMEWIVLGVGLVGMVVVTAVAMWLW